MTGVRCGQVFRDYEDVRARAGAVANGLVALDVTAGDRVAIYLHNEIAFIEASIGIGMLGAIPVIGTGKGPSSPICSMIAIAK
jgi:long-chain acyl-CoA synthetase